MVTEPRAGAGCGDAVHEAISSSMKMAAGRWRLETKIV
jgi:hypothetical protein